MVHRYTIDFETYSDAGFTLGAKVRGQGASGKGGLPVVGTPRYATHFSAEVLCLSYDGKLWTPAMPNPVELLDHVWRGGAVEAWNITFEFWFWNKVCVPRYGWPVLDLDQCYCAMAKSRRYSLPGALGNAAKLLGTTQKSKEGGRLIQKLTRPHTPTKNRPAYRWTPATAWDDFKALYSYCQQDTAAEHEVSQLTPELTPTERQIWLLDQRINLRGVQVDVQTLQAACKILQQAEARYNAELSRLTGGVVRAATELAAMQSWLAEAHLVTMTNMQAETIEAKLKEGTGSPVADRVLQIRQQLGGANIKKLHSLTLQTSDDGRLRDQYRYCGADMTARWAAGGVQLQNMTAKGPTSYECESCGGIHGEPHCTRCGAGDWLSHKRPEWDVTSVKVAIEDIRRGDLNELIRHWSDHDPLAVLTGCLRGLLIARPGYKLICCDFSAIEAVATACLARCQWRIDVFNSHGKIYEESASRATGIPFDEILAHKKQHGTHHPARATIGKVRELAGGFGGWIGAWKNFGADDFMSDEEIKQDVLKWRAESPEIVEAWGGQFRDRQPCLYGLEGAAIRAIMNPGQWFQSGDMWLGVFNDTLHYRLPSGRDLYYHTPRLVDSVDRFTRNPCYGITFMGWNSNSQQGPVGWVLRETYGGRLFQNGVQATARDIQAEAMLRVDAVGYPIVMHTHDEITAEVPEGWGSVDEMAAIMSERPAWAAWWPIRANGWIDTRYQK